MCKPTKSFYQGALYLAIVWLIVSFVIFTVSFAVAASKNPSDQIGVQIALVITLFITIVLTCIATREATRTSRIIYYFWNFIAILTVAFAGCCMQFSGTNLYSQNLVRSMLIDICSIDPANNRCAQQGAEFAGAFLAMIGIMISNIVLIFISDYDTKK